MNFIDTHTHLDGEEFAADLYEVVGRAREAGVSKVFVPAIDLKSVDTVVETCRKFPGYAYPMIGLHPEEVRADWNSVLDEMYKRLQPGHPFIAVGEVGNDYYWPLMIHCRKGQNEMVSMLRHYADELPGGVFHCFTGNEHEAEELLQFERFVLGIGGVLTFKKSHLPEVLPSVVPLNRIVLETDSPYMAPVPMRGKRNESAYVAYVLQKLAECYGVDLQCVADTTNATVKRIFGI